MTTGLSLGGLNTIGGITRLFGTSSKIDTATLVQAAYDMRRLPALRLETKIEQNQAKIAALGELRSLLTDLKDAVAGLRNPPGALGINDNVFEAKQAYLTSDTAAVPTSILGVSAGNTAPPSSFEVVVDRLATANKLTSATAAAADMTLADAWNGGAGFTGTIQVGLAGGATADIDVDGSMDLHDLAAAINAHRQTTKVAAQVLKVSDTEYRLVVSATETGKAIQISDQAGSASGLMGLGEVQAAQTARFSIDGVAIERTANRIDDLLPGITLELFTADPATTVTVGVEPALPDIKGAIGRLVDSYNAFREFVAKNTALDADGGVSDQAVLYGERILRSLSQAIGQETSRPVAGVTGEVRSLRDIGITLDASGRLAVDDGKLDQALLTNLDGVRDLLEFRFSASAPDIRVFSRTNGLADTAFDVAITDADGDGVAEAVSFDGVAGTVQGSALYGAAGTAYAGLQLLWAGSGSTMITVKATQGVADRFYNLLDEMLDGINGELQRTVDERVATNTRYAADIERINARAEAERDRMIVKFARMEEALARADALMQQIRAQMDAMNAKRD